MSLGFKATGIYLINLEIFFDEIFLPSSITHVPMGNCSKDSPTLLSVRRHSSLTPFSNDETSLTTIRPHTKINFRQNKRKSRQFKPSIITDKAKTIRRFPQTRESSNSEIKVIRDSDDSDIDSTNTTYNESNVPFDIPHNFFVVVKVYNGCGGSYKCSIAKLSVELTLIKITKTNF